MPNRIPTPGIPTPPVRKSSAAQAPAIPKNKTVTKGDVSTTYNAKGQPTWIQNKKTGASAGTAYTPGFKNGGGTQ